MKVRKNAAVNFWHGELSELKSSLRVNKNIMPPTIFYIWKTASPNVYVWMSEIAFFPDSIRKAIAGLELIAILNIRTQIPELVVNNG